MTKMTLIMSRALVEAMLHTVVWDALTLTLVVLAMSSSQPAL